MKPGCCRKGTLPHLLMTSSELETAVSGACDAASAPQLRGRAPGLAADRSGGIVWLIRPAAEALVSGDRQDVQDRRRGVAVAGLRSKPSMTCRAPVDAQPHAARRCGDPGADAPRSGPRLWRDG